MQEVQPTGYMQPLVSPERGATSAVTDDQLIAVWIETYRDASPHTIVLYERVARRFVAALHLAGHTFASATLEQTQAAVETLRFMESGGPALPATVATYIDAVRLFFNFAHRVGFTRFNAGPLTRSPRVPSMLAQRILSEFDVGLLLRAARPGRDDAILSIGYYGGLRISEIAGLRWSNVIARDSGEAQLDVIGKGGKVRQVLLPAELAKKLVALRCDAPADAPIFRISTRQMRAIVLATARRAGLTGNISPHWLRHAHASHALDNHAPISLVQATLGHASLSTTSAYVHARPGDSSSRYLK